uniref:Uncharacterized protein n=1 Tax=Musa acuminata subsp. malaccensis TaxID=214687 RepID=A0A804KQJ7_MUSAM
MAINDAAPFPPIVGSIAGSLSSSSAQDADLR